MYVRRGPAGGRRAGAVRARPRRLLDQLDRPRRPAGRPGGGRGARPARLRPQRRRPVRGLPAGAARPRRRRPHRGPRRRPGAPVRQLARRRGLDARRRRAPRPRPHADARVAGAASLRPRRGSDPRLPLLLLPGLERLARRRLAGADRRSSGPARVLALCYADPSRGSPGRGSPRRSRRCAGAARSAHDGEALHALAARPVGSYLVRGPARGLAAGGARAGADAARLGRPRTGSSTSRSAPRAAQTFPDSRLLVLDDVGHVAQMERPDLVARAFLGHARGAGRGPSRRAADAGPGTRRRPRPLGSGRGVRRQVRAT